MRAHESQKVTAVESAHWAPPLPDAPGFDHLVVETPGLRTHVATLGEGEPVLMLHGFPQHWWQWHDVAPLLAERGYRAVCPDLRGAGWTEADDPSIRRETRLRDVLALLDALGIDRVHVLSHDMGAVTAVQLSYAHPERVRRAVQLSVPPGFMSFSARLLPAFRHMPKLVWHRPGNSLRGVWTDQYCAKVTPEATVDAHPAPMRRPEVDGSVRALYRGMVLPEAMRLSRGTYRRRRLGVPTLFAFGRVDTRFDEALVRRLCANPERFADRVEFAFVDGAGKLLPDDAPGAVAELALDWFGRMD